MKQPEDIVMQLSSAGGEKFVDGGNKTKVQLLKMASSSAVNGGRIILFNMKQFDPPFLERLSNVGKGNILFDLR